MGEQTNGVAADYDPHPPAPPLVNFLEMGAASQHTEQAAPVDF